MAMYYTGLDPFTLKSVYVPKGREKKVQRAMMQYREPGNRAFVLEGLRQAGREDLIGNAANCLVSGGDTGNRGVHRQPPRWKK